MPDERQPGRDGDEPRPDETRPMRPVDDDATQVQSEQPANPPRSGDTPTAPISPAGEWDPWTGRAAVRSPGPEPARYAESDWSASGTDEEPAGRWWMPIVIGIVGLVLLALLGFGIYLIVQNSGADVDTPKPTPAQTRTTTTAAATEPTTEAPPSTVPTTEPTDTEATVPALRGMPLADAVAALQRSGLGYRVIQLPSDAEPGTVIDCDPAEGQVVPPDSKVTLVVAAERTEGPTPTTTAPTGGASTGPDED